MHDYRYNSWKGDFPPKLIVDWQEIDSYPSFDDIEKQDIQITSNDLDFAQEIGFYPECDRLSGWAEWIQTNECPECKICCHPMEHIIFQLQSNDNIPCSWGDGGTGYIFQCSDHVEEVAFLYQ